LSVKRASYRLHTHMRLLIASKMPNDSAQFAPCSFLTAFPLEGQEIDCKMQSNSH
jgi:hypothetical protein